MAPHEPGRWRIDRRLEPRRVLRHALATAAHNGGGLAALRVGRHAMRGVEVRIVSYHRVVADIDRAVATTMPPLSISAESFAAHIGHLAQCYEVLPLVEAGEVLAGRREAPDRDIAVITFDDGYHDVLRHAAPILRARHVPATIFITTDPVEQGRPLLHDRIYALVGRIARSGLGVSAVAAPADTRWSLARADAALAQGDLMGASEALLLALPRGRVELLADLFAARVGEPEGEEVPRCLTWDEIRELRAQGFEIGGHTVTHAHLPLESDEELTRELVEGSQVLERRLGEAPRSLAYPAGRYDGRVVAAARRAGYSIAVTTEDRPNHPGDDLLRLGRKVLSDEHGRGTFGLSRALVAAQLDGLFSTLGLSQPVSGEFVLEEPWPTK